MKKKLEAITRARQEDLQALNNHLQEQITETKEEQEKREELEMYSQVQEEKFVDLLVKVQMARDKLDKNYKALEEKYE